VLFWACEDAAEKASMMAETAPRAVMDMNRGFIIFFMLLFVVISHPPMNPQATLRERFNGRQADRFSAFLRALATTFLTKMKTFASRAADRSVIQFSPPRRGAAGPHRGCFIRWSLSVKSVVKKRRHRSTRPRR
jgi:hypothetical protein